MGWGEIAKAFSEALPKTPLKNVAGVPLLGSLTCRSSIATYEATTAPSARLNTESYYLLSLILCNSIQSRDTLKVQPMMPEVLILTRALDLAVVSVGRIYTGKVR